MTFELKSQISHFFYINFGTKKAGEKVIKIKY